MKFLVKCELPDVLKKKRCNHIFTANDEIPSDHDYTCPRCGRNAAKILFTAEQVRNHAPYRHIGTGTILRVGLEARQVVKQGYYFVDTRTGKAMRYDQGIPLLGSANA